MVGLGPMSYEGIPAEHLDKMGIAIKYDVSVKAAEFLASIYPTGQDNWHDYEDAKSYLQQNIELSQSQFEGACKCIIDKLHL